MRGRFGRGSCLVLARETDALSGCRLLVLPDTSFLTMDIYDDMVGYPFYKTFLRRIDDFRTVADLWEGKSKDVYLKILAYRLTFFRPLQLAPGRLPCPSAKYEQTAQPVPELPASLEPSLAGAIREGFAHPHYVLPGFMRPRPGDTVLDCGAWEGDTAYWFARQVGRGGKIVAFEPSPYNCRRFSEQWPREAEIGDVAIIQKAVDEKSGIVSWMDFPEAGTCSRIGEGNNSQQVQVTSIDDFCLNSGTVVNFIKTDLEGADFGALKGARRIIERDQPDLAISIYHTADHLVDIPLWIRHHFPEYRLRVSHNHVGVNETICMATQRELPEY